MKIVDLISEMQAVKAEHPGLEVQDILKLFQIQAIQEQTLQLKIRNQRNGR